MAFDECPPSLADRAYHEVSLARTQRWLVRCRDAWRRLEDEKARPARRRRSRSLFGIAQGGLFPDLRARAIEEAAALDLPGYALGGYAVGEAPGRMWEGVARDAPLLPAGKPRYLMGVGTPGGPPRRHRGGRGHVRLRPPDAHRAQRPPLHEPREARHPQRRHARTTRGRSTPRAPATRAGRSPARTCATCSRRARCSGLRLNTLHNLHFYLSLMDGARRAIEEGRFERVPPRAARGLAGGRTRRRTRWTPPPNQARKQRFSAHLLRPGDHRMSPVLHAFFAQTAPEGQAANPIGAFLPFILIALVFYFVFFRPQSKQAKQHKAFLGRAEEGRRGGHAGRDHRDGARRSRTGPSRWTSAAGRSSGS